MLESQQQIASWRRALADKIGPDPNTLDELESHLRDEMDRLVRQGQAPEHAVLAAITKIGTADKLATEFAKVARPWWPIRVVLAGTLLAIVGSLVLIGSWALRGPWDGLLLTPCRHGDHRLFALLWHRRAGAVLRAQAHGAGSVHRPEDFLAPRWAA